MSLRDNFTKPTVKALAERVGYRCSNPACRAYTIGPHTEENKATIVGVAAHITAAAPNGPRYDANLSPDQRRHINNAIWLCGTCSTNIDKDPTHFPVSLLNSWKSSNETETRQLVAGAKTENKKTPYIEADLIWSYGGRWNRGYSPKNKTSIRDGKKVIEITPDVTPIIYWDLDWNFSFVLHNSSSYPAINIKVESIGDVNFSEISKLNKFNNLPPFTSMDLTATYHESVEGTYLEADQLLLSKIPKSIEGLKLKITYLDEDRNQHITIATIVNNELVSIKS